ncbi:anti-sigma factor [Shewanella sp. VB17]|uniref:sigma-E factor negative regulatory protein n=1 Tax=Shewanella sp. VB17 TaxID=2739432 RepID=UPI0015669332|nr:anti sigma-E factor RseA C-terminal domain-containing protein [Shewanella sp. VB17]NRD72984.1 anti-sigma factor [Shewanella sp. VB17]
MDKLGQEWVSAAVDGEVDEQALAELIANQDSHEQWHDYHMIGDAMRGELPKAINLNLCASIAAAIELEPTFLAPVKPKLEEATPAIKSNVIPMFKQFGQYAIAASVALVAVVGVQNYSQDSIDTSPLPVLNTRPLLGSVTPVSLQTAPVKNNQGYNNVQVMEQRQRINAYIQDHMLQQRLNNGVNIDDNSQNENAPAALSN